ncbi:MAG: hypothetical protein A2381_08080 [Bdellovibrionales bacterium RIFOXYB1_FULL_37_110]|nr:MAG: hypothetical protein A2181_04845 [Bdellovibrionales bacterium RIFOXYA1_FULL_38_20]OFZ52562.1 MAG: hypothetical protein A2417_00800 [Bdellovibrionales bacterium RIFOXYC1_FULL_37_79]OFZ59764.1 MAG: hypothetical protein A2381_08080 [Bdellovibrionales bacterium RIFOXYB1_FULL_37_110]OFZ65329.1 MAG: hypothetical protein A2577_04250 [Bdellovibrionales bacterium RIFOXYD1_FULL_36_51]
MNIENIVRGVAGTFILLTLALSRFHHEYWLFVTAFVGLNLLQSAFTGICPMVSILKKLGFKENGNRGCCK